MAGSLIQHSSNHKLLLLMLSLLAVLLIHPFVNNHIVGRLAVDIAYTCVLLSVIYVFYKRVVLTLFIVILAIPLVAGQWFLFFEQNELIRLVSFSFGSLFFIFLSAVLIKKILEALLVTFDTIYGSISVYLMFGLGFAFMFGIADYFYTDSLQMADGRSITHDTNYLHTLIYFSFTSLTTLGFGDINPVAPVSRTLSYLEAIVGQVYLMVLVARLVGLHIAHTHRKD
jgi:hypothetical protein